jgi:hypothetical protein
MAIPRQLLATKGKSKKKYRGQQVAAMEAQLGMLPQKIAAENARKAEMKRQEFETAKFKEGVRQYDEQKRLGREQAIKEQGASALKFAGGAAISELGGIKGGLLGSVGRQLKGTSTLGAGKVTGMGSPGAMGRNPADTGPIGGSKAGLFSGLSGVGALQGGLSGGLGGFGLASLFGGNKKQRLISTIGGTVLGSVLGSGALTSTLGSLGQFVGMA